MVVTLSYLTTRVLGNSTELVQAWQREVFNIYRDHLILIWCHRTDKMCICMILQSMWFLAIFICSQKQYPRDVSSHKTIVHLWQPRCTLNDLTRLMALHLLYYCYMPSRLGQQLNQAGFCGNSFDVMALYIGYKQTMVAMTIWYRKPRSTSAVSLNTPHRNHSLFMLHIIIVLIITSNKYNTSVVHATACQQFGIGLACRAI